jgi:hypothetical protein
VKVNNLFQAVGHGKMLQLPFADEGLATDRYLLGCRRVDHVVVICGISLAGAGRGESDMEVMYRQQFGLSGGEPLEIGQLPHCAPINGKVMHDDFESVRHRIQQQALCGPHQSSCGDFCSLSFC